MSYTSEQYKYMLFKRLQRHCSMTCAKDRAYTQGFFWKLFDESITITEDVFNHFVTLMDDQFLYCANNNIYRCDNIPKDIVNERGKLLSAAFSELGIKLVVENDGGKLTFTKPNGETMIYITDTTHNWFNINAKAGTEYQYAKASASAYGMANMTFPDSINPKIAGPGTFWNYNAGTLTMTISGDGAYAGATDETQMGSGKYTTVIIGPGVSRLLGQCVSKEETAMVLLHPSDGQIIISPEFNSRETLNVYTDCTAAIVALSTEEQAKRITLHSLSEWNG